MFNTKKGFSAIEIIISIIVIGILTIVAWMFINKINNPSAGSILKPEDLIAKIKTELSKKYTIVNQVDDEYNDIGEKIKPSQSLDNGQLVFSKETGVNIANDKLFGTGSLNSYGPMHKVDGYNFSLRPAEGASLNWWTGPGTQFENNDSQKIQIENIKKEVKNILNNSGLSEYKEVDYDDGFIGKGLLCTTDYYQSITCASIESYNESSKKVNEILSGLQNRAEAKDCKYFSSPYIKDSKLNGYKVAYMYACGFPDSGIYLYKNTQGDWYQSLSTNPSGQLLCESINTVELRDIWDGVECI
jgi:prepilin-type N-terminal cleavage/methylation domain-containing protein